MRSRLVLGTLAAAAALVTAPAASASHHVDCARPFAGVCAVVNHTVFCHTTPPC